MGVALLLVVIVYHVLSAEAKVLEQLAKVGQNVQLFCNASIAEHVQWTRHSFQSENTHYIYLDGKVQEPLHHRFSVLPEANSNCNLSIANVKLVDSGLYFCIAGGLRNYTTELCVSDDKELDHQVVCIGQSATLSCTPVCKLSKDIDWLHRSELGGFPHYVYSNGLVYNGYLPRCAVTHVGGVYYLTIQNVTKQDEGFYMCIEGKGLGREHKSQLLVSESQTCTSAAVVRSAESDRLVAVPSNIWLIVAIVFIVAFCVLLVLLVVCALTLYYRRMKKKKRASQGIAAVCDLELPHEMQPRAACAANLDPDENSMLLTAEQPTSAMDMAFDNLADDQGVPNGSQGLTEMVAAEGMADVYHVVSSGSQELAKTAAAEDLADVHQGVSSASQEPAESAAAENNRPDSEDPTSATVVLTDIPLIPMEMLLKKVAKWLFVAYAKAVLRPDVELFNTLWLVFGYHWLQFSGRKKKKVPTATLR